MTDYNILVTVDNNYVTPLQVMLKSLFVNNVQKTFSIYLIYHDLSAENLANIQSFCALNKAELLPIFIDNKQFEQAPTSDRYSYTMYYRLLACKLLPDTLDKILYLDPDMLIINPIDILYQLDISQHLFAAAIHTQLLPISDQVNKIRLGTYETDGYYNSGVLLMNLAKQRQIIKAPDIFAYIEQHGAELLLPDQDIFNSLYGTQTLSIDDSLYNYDARNFETYRLWDSKKGMTWVMRNTVVLHFCGRNKPWKKKMAHRFAILYKHYEQMMLRDIELKKYPLEC